MTAAMVAFVCANDDRWEVVFAADGGEARAAAADRGVAHAKVSRVPELDQFSPGPVTDQQFLDAGWTVACDLAGCGHEFSAKGCLDGAHRDAGPPVLVQDALAFCSASCFDMARVQAQVHPIVDAERPTSEEAAKHLCQKFVEEQCPELTLVSVMAERVGQTSEWAATAVLTFPGATRPVFLPYGLSDLLIDHADLAAYEQHLRSRAGG